MRNRFTGKIKNLLILLNFLPLALAQAAPNETIAVQAGELPAPAQIQRIQSVGKVSDVLLFSLAPEKIIGMASQDLDRPNRKYLSEQVHNLPYTGKLAGKGSTYPIEKLIESKPDLIVDVGNVSKTYVATAEKIQQQTHILFVIINGRFSETDKQISSLAAMIGETAHGEKLAKFAREVLDRTQHITSARIYAARGATGLETGLKGSIHTEVVEWIGAQNVADVEGNHGIATVSMEQLLQWQPDVILTQDPTFYTNLKQDAIWQNLNAVKQGRIFLVPNALFGWLDAPPSVNRLLGAIWLSHKLAPTQLTRAEAAQLIKTYFTLFYQYTLSDAEVAQFLD